VRRPDQRQGDRGAEGVADRHGAGGQVDQRDEDVPQRALPALVPEGLDQLCATADQQQHTEDDHADGRQRHRHAQADRAEKNEENAEASSHPQCCFTSSSIAAPDLELKRRYLPSDISRSRGSTVCEPVASGHVAQRSGTTPACGYTESVLRE